MLFALSIWTVMCLPIGICLEKEENGDVLKTNISKIRPEIEASVNVNLFDVLRVGTFAHDKIMALATAQDSPGAIRRKCDKGDTNSYGPVVTEEQLTNVQNTRDEIKHVQQETAQNEVRSSKLYEIEINMRNSDTTSEGKYGYYMRYVGEPSGEEKVNLHDISEDRFRQLSENKDDTLSEGNVLTNERDRTRHKRSLWIYPYSKFYGNSARGTKRHYTDFWRWYLPYSKVFDPLASNIIG